MQMLLLYQTGFIRYRLNSIIFCFPFHFIANMTRSVTQSSLDEGTGIRRGLPNAWTCISSGTEKRKLGQALS